MKKCLITETTGFVGSNLKKFLLKKKYKVFGLNRRKTNDLNDYVFVSVFGRSTGLHRWLICMYLQNLFPNG